MKDKAQKADWPEDRKASCGYRINDACCRCFHCRRTFHAKGHDAQMMSAVCDLHGFDVNLELGICNDFDHIGKYRT